VFPGGMVQVAVGELIEAEADAAPQRIEGLDALMFGGDRVLIFIDSILMYVFEPIEGGSSDLYLEGIYNLDEI